MLYTSIYQQRYVDVHSMSVSQPCLCSFQLLIFLLTCIYSNTWTDVYVWWPCASENECTEVQNHRRHACAIFEDAHAIEQHMRGFGSTDIRTRPEAVYLCNRAVPEKKPTNIWPPLPTEYMTVFSGQSDAPVVRCDTQTHTWSSTITFAAHAHRGLIIEKRTRD